MTGIVAPLASTVLVRLVATTQMRQATKIDSLVRFQEGHGGGETRQKRLQSRRDMEGARHGGC